MTCSCKRCTAPRPTRRSQRKGPAYGSWCRPYMIMFAVSALASVACMATKAKLFFDKVRARRQSGSGDGGHGLALSSAARQQNLKERLGSNKLDQYRVYAPLCRPASCPVRRLVAAMSLARPRYCDLVLVICEVRSPRCIAILHHLR